MTQEYFTHLTPKATLEVGLISDNATWAFPEISDGEGFHISEGPGCRAGINCVLDVRPALSALF